MSIQVISNLINQEVSNHDSAFTTHDVIEVLIKKYKKDRNNYVMQYRKESRNIRVQEQIAVREIGRYLSRNTKTLHIKNNGKLKSNEIKGLIEHKPRITTQWMKN